MTADLDADSDDDGKILDQIRQEATDTLGDSRAKGSAESSSGRNVIEEEAEAPLVKRIRKRAGAGQSSFQQRLVAKSKLPIRKTSNNLRKLAGMTADVEGEDGEDI